MDFGRLAMCADIMCGDGGGTQRSLAAGATAPLVVIVCIVIATVMSMATVRVPVSVIVGVSMVVMRVSPAFFCGERDGCRCKQ